MGSPGARPGRRGCAGQRRRRVARRQDRRGGGALGAGGPASGRRAILRCQGCRTRGALWCAGLTGRQGTARRRGASR